MEKMEFRVNRDPIEKYVGCYALPMQIKLVYSVGHKLLKFGIYSSLGCDGNTVLLNEFEGEAAEKMFIALFPNGIPVDYRTFPDSFENCGRC